MRNKNKEIRAHDRALQFLRAGKSVPDAFLQRRIADVKRGPMDRSKGKYAIDKQYAKYWSQIQKPPKVDKERRIAQATDGILGIHKNLAK